MNHDCPRKSRSPPSSQSSPASMANREADYPSPKQNGRLIDRATTRSRLQKTRSVYSYIHFTTATETIVRASTTSSKPRPASLQQLTLELNQKPALNQPFLTYSAFAHAYQLKTFSFQREMIDEFQIERGRRFPKLMIIAPGLAHVPFCFFFYNPSNHIRSF